MRLNQRRRFETRCGGITGVHARRRLAEAHTRTLSAHTAPSLHLHLHPGDLGHEYRNDGATPARFTLTIYEPAGHGQ